MKTTTLTVRVPKPLPAGAVTAEDYSKCVQGLMAAISPLCVGHGAQVLSDALLSMYARCSTISPAEYDKVEAEILRELANKVESGEIRRQYAARPATLQ